MPKNSKEAEQKEETLYKMTCSQGVGLAKRDGFEISPLCVLMSNG